MLTTASCHPTTAATSTCSILICDVICPLLVIDHCHHGKFLCALLQFLLLMFHSGSSSTNCKSEDESPLRVFLLMSPMHATSRSTPSRNSLLAIQHIMETTMISMLFSLHQTQILINQMVISDFTFKLTYQFVYSQ